MFFFFFLCIISEQLQKYYVLLFHTFYIALLSWLILNIIIFWFTIFSGKKIWVWREESLVYDFLSYDEARERDFFCVVSTARYSRIFSAGDNPRQKPPTRAKRSLFCGKKKDVVAPTTISLSFGSIVVIQTKRPSRHTSSLCFRRWVDSVAVMGLSVLLLFFVRVDLMLVSESETTQKITTTIWLKQRNVC